MKVHTAVGAGLACLLLANSGKSQNTGYSGPNILSRFSREPGGGIPVSNSLRMFLHSSYSYLGGLAGPVDLELRNLGGRAGNSSTNNLSAGGGMNFTHFNSRGALSLNYQGNYTYPFTGVANSYGGINQDLNLNYERQLTRRWGFYTGHGAGSQRSILSLARPSSQNIFDQTYSITNEALDARLRYWNSNAGLFFRKSRRLAFSMDGGVFTVVRTSEALASSRGERAQAEISYQVGRKQTIAAVYSFSHFYYKRGFGETYTQMAMLSLTRRLSQTVTLQFSGGPYRSESDRLRSVKVDPYIASITGQFSTVEVFHGTHIGWGGGASLGAKFHKGNFLAAYRRSIDPGNGITLTALSDIAQVGYTHNPTRKLSFGASLFGTRMDPLLTGVDNNSNFRSYGGFLNAGYRLGAGIHVVSNFGIHSVAYDALNISKIRKSASIGLAFSPGPLPVFR